MGVSPSKKAKSDLIDIDDFDLDDGENNEDFEAGTLDLKDSSLKIAKPEIKTGMKPSNLKSDYNVTEKQEPEEPPKWFQAYAAVVGRLEKQLIVTMEKVEELRYKKRKRAAKRR
jgi:hypothetical protein